MKKELSIFQKYDNMKKRYRETQRRFTVLRRLVRELFNEYDGHRAMDIWDEDLMPSKEWITKMRSLEQKLIKLKI